jgi:hypothetical protein
MKRKISIPLTLCFVGGVIALIGELHGATDEEAGGTLSEWYRDLPTPFQHLISWLFGAVCAHLWNWMLTPKPMPAVEVQGDVNIETHGEC